MNLQASMMKKIDLFKIDYNLGNVTARTEVSMTALMQAHQLLIFFSLRFGSLCNLFYPMQTLKKLSLDGTLAFFTDCGGRSFLQQLKSKLSNKKLFQIVS